MLFLGSVPFHDHVSVLVAFRVCGFVFHFHHSVLKMHSGFLYRFRWVTPGRHSRKAEAVILTASSFLRNIKMTIVEFIKIQSLIFSFIISYDQGEQARGDHI